MLMERQYAKYYGNPKNKQRDLELAKEMWELSQDTPVE